MTELEFWPEYGSGPLWDGGTAFDGTSALSSDLLERLRAWNDAYDDDKLPMDHGGDAAWVSEGQRLLDEVRAALAESHTVVVTEPWWA